jgi:subfamily B ATP-binding cassette protein MsbA
VFRPFLALVGRPGWALPAVIVLGLLAPLFEGVGIGLLVPLLNGFAGAGEGGSGSAAVDWLGNLFADVSPDRRLAVIVCCIFLVIVLKNALGYGNALVYSAMTARVGHRMRTGIFRQLLTVGLSYVEGEQSGRLMNVLTTETWRTTHALSQFVALIVAVCSVLVLGSLLLLLSWRLTLVVALAMLVIAGIVHLATRSVRRSGEVAVAANKSLTLRMCEGLAGMRLIRAFGREDYEAQRFDEASDRVRNTFFRLDAAMTATKPLYEVLSALVLLAALLGALIEDRTSLPAMLSFLLILFRIQPQVRQIVALRATLAGLAGAVGEVTALLTEEDKPYLASGTRPFHHLERGIVFETVTFRHAGGRSPALEQATLSIPRGSTTALVGPSGAGKSSLVGLLCRFYDPDSGAVLIDGVPLPELDLASWRGRLAVVGQDPHMFSASVRENIAYGKLDATLDEIVSAARLAQAHDFIEDLPEGYDTTVGDRGSRLSGGQRQRIALARAIVRNPDILILDEPTNALDTLSERLVQDAIEALAKERTVLVVAHRLSTIGRADRVVVLDQGRVVEEGTPSQLLRAGGLFARLYRADARLVSGA